MTLRSLLAVALLAPAAALAAPAPSAKPSSKPAASAGSPAEALELGGFIGYETDDPSGISLRGDLEIPFRRLNPQVKLSWVASVGYSRLTEDISYGTFSANILKFVPSARFTIPINPQFSVFGDAGLGFYYAWWNTETSFPNFPSSSIDSTEFNLMMRIGAGAWYHLSPQLKLGALFELDPFFGDFDQNTLLVQVGAMFRL
jgi:opacity protein-like surface antigen